MGGGRPTASSAALAVLALGGRGRTCMVRWLSPALCQAGEIVSVSTRRRACRAALARCRLPVLCALVMPRMPSGLA